MAQEHVTHPYGPGSSFDLLRQHEAKVLGLGVSLNTSSLALLPDAELGDRHTAQVFTPDLEDGIVVDARGKRLVTRSVWLLPDAVRLIKPSILFARSDRLRSATSRHDEGPTIQFAYPYAVYHAEAIRLGEEACATGKAVPWFEDFPLRGGSAVRGNDRRSADEKARQA
jgi:hypothetical protein